MNAIAKTTQPRIVFHFLKGLKKMKTEVSNQEKQEKYMKKTKVLEHTEK